MAVDLRFRSPLDTSHPVNLRFGAVDGGDTATVLAFDITLSPPAVSVALESFERWDVGFDIALAGPTVSVHLDYDLGLTTGPQARAAASWEVADKQSAQSEAVFEQAATIKPQRAAPWGVGTPVHADHGTTWQQNTAAPVERRAAFEEATPVRHQRSTWWQESTPVRHRRTARWQEATGVSQRRAARWQQMGRQARPTHSASWQDGSPLSRRTDLGFGIGTTLSISRRAPWQEARYPLPGRSQIGPPVQPEPDPCYIPPAGDAVDLVFLRPWDGSTNLLFVCDRHPVDPSHPPLVIVPVRRVYMVLNETSLWRVDGDVHIPCHSMSLSLDVDSWTWSFSASVPAQALSAVEPEDGMPTELEVRLNGVAYRVLAEKISRDRSFGKSRISVGGRGKSALLDAPFATVQNFGNTEDRSAQQLMADALTTNGVSIGWDIDWRIDDWLVPAGAWTMQGTHIAAVNAIAAAAGAYVQPHRVNQELQVLARYPVAPWNWLADVTPDFELPAAVTTRESIEWVDKARYNRVFVSGQAMGVLGQVTRTGTAGDIVAPMVTDPLITEAVAARQRGLSILGDTGRQANVGLRLPVLPETGLIQPGKFVSYVDGGTTRLGLVRSTAVEIAGASVWQSLNLETHV